MALSLLTKPSPSRALLIARLHHASPASSMANTRFSGEVVKSSTLSQVGCRSLPSRSFNGVAELNVLGTGNPFCLLVPLRAVHSSAGEVNPLCKASSSSGQALGLGLTSASCKHALISCSRGMKQRCFCSSSGQINGPSQRNVENAQPMNNSDIHNRVHPSQQQQSLHSANSNMTQQQQPANPAGSNQQQQPTFPPGNQQPGYASHMGSPPAGAYTPNSQQRGYVPPAGAPSGAHVSGDQNRRIPGYSTPNMSSGTSAGGAPPPPPPPPPRTSAAAEVIDKYLGPSTLKLEKRDDKAPPPPPPRRNYGPQGTQEKKSGKDLVAESAACAVIEKYLGPWPGFPPRDPKIDEYLDSLPENAACAAIDKYFGPYKPLFVFKKNEGEANNPPPPSRPPRNRMMSRARNRQWNASQQGASVDRPWTPPQQGPPVNATQGGQAPQGAAAPPSQGPVPSQQPAGNLTSQPGMMTNQTAAPQQGASTVPPQGANRTPPHGAGFSPPCSNSS